MAKTTTLIILFLFSAMVLPAQKSAESLEKDEKSLQERFEIMKELSETYGDYKVIRRYVLDGVWKIVTDTLTAERVLKLEANKNILRLETELAHLKDTIKEKDIIIHEADYNGSHIAVMGMDFPKTGFVAVVGIIILSLLIVLGVLFTRLKWVHSSIREKSEMADLLSAEFEEYKRKALDKQMKLSRELQTERNKAQEFRK